MNPLAPDFAPSTSPTIPAAGPAKAARHRVRLDKHATGQMATPASAYAPGPQPAVDAASMHPTGFQHRSAACDSFPVTQHANWPTSEACPTSEAWTSSKGWQSSQGWPSSEAQHFATNNNTHAHDNSNIAQGIRNLHIGADTFQQAFSPAVEHNIGSEKQGTLPTPPLPGEMRPRVD